MTFRHAAYVADTIFADVIVRPNNSDVIPLDGCLLSNKKDLRSILSLRASTMKVIAAFVLLTASAQALSALSPKSKKRASTAVRC
jgi:hypothetical protein